VLSRQTEWIDSISRTLRWNTRAASQKSWVNGQGEDDNDNDSAIEEPRERKTEPDFDIDFDQEEARDSGYSAEGSSVGVGGGSPRGARRQLVGF
jgi:NAD+ kinase